MLVTETSTMVVKFLDLFILYDARKRILQHLSAWEIAKLDVCLGHVLDDHELTAYIRASRDLFFNVKEMDCLVAEGMKLVLLGNDVRLLHTRLQDPVSYLKRSRTEKKLQIYLLGVFPVQIRDKHLLHRMLTFCIHENPDLARFDYDKAAFEAIRRRGPKDKLFMMSFSAPFKGGRIEDRGFWHRVETPDAFVDLRVYVPCFRDRAVGEVMVQPLELSRLSGHAARLQYLWTIWTFLAVYVHKFTLDGVVYPEQPRDTQFTLRFLHTKSVVDIV
jgi:hypothetical protein